MTNALPGKQGRYFDLKLISRNDDKRAVCFTTDKRNQFQHFQEQKSALKIKNFEISKKFGSENILIGKKTSVELIDKPNDFEQTVINSNSILSIKQLNKISTNQIIFVKVTVQIISSVKKLKPFLPNAPFLYPLKTWGSHGKVVDRRELTVADPTGDIKVLL